MSLDENHKRLICDFVLIATGVLSTEQTPVASPQLHFTSSSTQLKQQHSPQNTTPSRYSYRRKNPSPGNSSGSEETIRVCHKV